MRIRLGNLSPEQFAAKVGTSFTPYELLYLHAVCSQEAELIDDEDYHIFEHPAVVVTVGSADPVALSMFKAANDRAPFNRPVSFFVDAAEVSR